MKKETDVFEDRFIVYEKLARENFGFLVEIFGFKLAPVEKSDDGYIALKYLSERVFINLIYGPPEFELDFYIGRRGIEDQPDKHSFTSGDLLYLEGCEKWVGYSVYSAHSHDNLRNCLPKLANLLKDCGKPCLRGDSSAFDKMLSERKKNVTQWHMNQELAQVRNDAAVAWARKDYPEVVKQLTPFKNEITPSERKKLEYSRKYIESH